MSLCRGSGGYHPKFIISSEHKHMKFCVKPNAAKYTTQLRHGQSWLLVESNTGSSHNCVYASGTQATCQQQSIISVIGRR